MEGLSAVGDRPAHGNAPQATGMAGGQSTAEGPSSPLLAGWIDLTQVRPGLVQLRVSGPDKVIAGPGVSIRTPIGKADVYAEGTSVVLLLGSPTLDGRRVNAAEFAAARTWPDLGGRFAAVVVDLGGKTVELRTDRFGVWPLCWSREGQRLAFSDRADCVPTLGPLALDRQSLFDYVYFHMIPSPRTVFRGVSRVAPASVLRVDASGLSTQRWWEPRFSKARSGPEPALAERFRAVIRDAVSSEGDEANVGCFLSGGTDSSTVAGMLKATSGSAETFSIGFDEEGYDEMEYARIAATHFGTRHHEHYVTPAELVASIPVVAAHYDQPFGNSSAVPAYICARMARENGIEKLLAGDGGDELFGGNSRYARQKIFEAFWQLPQPMRRSMVRLLGNAWMQRAPILRKGASYVAQASVSMPGRMETYNLLNRFGPEHVFRPDFLEGVDQGAPAELQRHVYAEQVEAPFVDRMMAYDWRFTLADNDLPKVTGTTRLAAMDVGFPLLADALVDLSMELGPGDKVHGLRLRHFFKQSLVDFLPAQIIAKKKHGFGLPVGKWLVKDSGFRALARGAVSSLADRRLILPGLVDDLFSRHLEQHPGYYGEMVWVLMMLEQWLSAHCPNWQDG